MTVKRPLATAVPSGFLPGNAPIAGQNERGPLVPITKPLRVRSKRSASGPFWAHRWRPRSRLVDQSGIRCELDITSLGPRRPVTKLKPSNASPSMLAGDPRSLSRAAAAATHRHSRHGDAPPVPISLSVQTALAFRFAAFHPAIAILIESRCGAVVEVTL